MERQRQTRESQQLLEETFPFPFFLTFSPARQLHYSAACRAGTIWLKEKQPFLADKQSYKRCLKNHTDSVVWKRSQALNRNSRDREKEQQHHCHTLWSHFCSLKSKAQKHRETEGKRWWWGVMFSGLPKIVQGIHVAGEDSAVLKPGMKAGIKGRDYGGEGEVSAWEESAVHMLDNAEADTTFLSSPVTSCLKEPLRQQSRHTAKTDRE